MAWPNDGAGDFDDRRCVPRLGRAEGIDVLLDARSTELEKGGAKERDTVVTNSNWVRRGDESVQDGAAQSGVTEELGDQEAEAKTSEFRLQHSCYLGSKHISGQINSLPPATVGDARDVLDHLEQNGLHIRPRGPGLKDLLDRDTVAGDKRSAISLGSSCSKSAKLEWT